MEKAEKKHITIIGAGLGGSFLALALAKHGFKVEVYERFTEEEIMNNYTSSRSYNLTFYDYGVNVLKNAGVWDTIKPNLVKLVGEITQIAHNPPRFTKDKPYYAIQRATLLKILITQARSYPSVTFHFGKALLAINRYEKTILIQDMQSNAYKNISCDVIFGADGVNSQVRNAIQQRQQATHVQEYADWEYKQIHLDKDLVNKLGLQTNLMYAWTRKNAVILAHPNIDQSISALLILPKEGKGSFASLANKSVIEQFVKSNFSELLPALPAITKAILENPRSQFVTIYTNPWYYKGFMAILGDAAHGFNPFYGQGVSAAFADCMIISQLLDTHGPQWDIIFPLYQKARKKHTDALATLSKESILQYRRHKKADYASIYNKFDVMLYHLFPKLFSPPPYVHIATNPLLAGDYLEKHRAQRKKAKLVGMPLVVRLVTGVIALQEILANLINKKRPQKEEQKDA